MIEIEQLAHGANPALAKELVRQSASLDEHSVAQLIEEILQKVGPFGGPSLVMDILNGRDYRPSVDDILAWCDNKERQWSLGKCVGYLIRSGCFSSEDAFNSLKKWFFVATDERTVDELSFAIWVLCCGAWIGVDTGWKVRQLDVPDLTVDLSELLASKKNTDYSRRIFQECMSRFSD